MPKEILDFDVLKKEIEEQVKSAIEKIVSKKVLTEWTDKAKVSYYWNEFGIEVKVPLPYKGSNMEGKVDVSFKLRFYIME